ncbi:MAG: PaaI family thioesterase [Novosphingobium sp.]|nr:PaaI family thioesterase [Novosphingobium sp.]
MSDADEAPIRGGFEQVGEGPWAGWWKWAGKDPFEDGTGPFFVKADERGIVTGFRPEAKNLNGHGSVHGGALMTFADFSLFMVATSGGDEVFGVTVTMNCEFVSGAQAGDLLTARGECVRAGGSLVFARGTILRLGADGAEEPVLSFSGTIKRAKRTSH